MEVIYIIARLGIIILIYSHIIIIIPKSIVLIDLRLYNIECENGDDRKSIYNWICRESEVLEI